MVEARGETTPKAEEEVLPEENEAEVLQLLMVEERIRIQVSQVVNGLINKKFNVIMHMNVGRNSITKEEKS